MVGRACGFALLLALLSSGAAEARVFRFVDGDGVVHYSDTPTDPRSRPIPDWTPAASARGRVAPSPGPSRPLAPFAGAIRAAAARHGLDPRLVEAVVLAESAGNPVAVSPKGARGLMQLMPERAAALGVQDPFDPLQNLDGGVRHLRDLLRRFRGDLTLALAAYNAGADAILAHGGVPPYAETREYVRRVRALYEGLALAGDSAAVAAPQRIYRHLLPDGSILFTNLPPPARALRP